MTDYTKLTDFASKDTLPTGNAAKIVKGTEIDDEFEAIETAVATKANINSPTFTGVPAAPTASAATNTTQLATTAFVTSAVATATSASALVNALYPVGSIYINATNNTNPGTLLGHGTWIAFGAGRVPVGFDSSDTAFDTAEETGGAKTHTLTVSELPAHSHDLQYFANTGGSAPFGAESSGNNGINLQPLGGGTTSVGGGSAHNNLQPYIVVYMWKRTA